MIGSRRGSPVILVMPRPNLPSSWNLCLMAHLCVLLPCVASYFRRRPVPRVRCAPLQQEVVTTIRANFTRRAVRIAGVVGGPRQRSPDGIRATSKTGSPRASASRPRSCPSIPRPYAWTRVGVSVRRMRTPPRWRTQNGQWSPPRLTRSRGLRGSRTPPPLKHFRRYQVPREDEVTERIHVEPSWLSSTDEARLATDIKLGRALPQ